MDEETLLGWFSDLMKLGGSSGGIRAVRTREGYVAKMGVFTSAPAPGLLEALAALKQEMKEELQTQSFDFAYGNLAA
jgi:hypothetical protein